MFVFGNFMGAVAWLVGLVFDALMLVILRRFPPQDAKAK